MLNEALPTQAQPEAQSEKHLSCDEVKIIAAYRLLLSQGRPFNLHVQWNGCATRIMRSVILSTTAVTSKLASS